MHDRECLKCGMEADTAVEVDGGVTIQADAQFCVWESNDGAWVFFHEYGGGPRGGEYDDEKQRTTRGDG